MMVTGRYRFRQDPLEPWASVLTLTRRRGGIDCGIRPSRMCRGVRTAHGQTQMLLCLESRLRLLDGLYVSCTCYCTAVFARCRHSMPCAHLDLALQRKVGEPGLEGVLDRVSLPPTNNLQHHPLPPVRPHADAAQDYVHGGVAQRRCIPLQDLSSRDTGLTTSCVRRHPTRSTTDHPTTPTRQPIVLGRSLTPSSLRPMLAPPVQPSRWESPGSGRS